MRAQRLLVLRPRLLGVIADNLLSVIQVQALGSHMMHYCRLRLEGSLELVVLRGYHIRDRSTGERSLAGPLLARLVYSVHLLKI